MDRTIYAVQVQLRAMACERYEIGLRGSATGTMIPRTWGIAAFERGIAWLKHKNAHGHDIYVRPAGSVGLLLVDDLSVDALVRMQDEGFTPAVVVETSRQNFQAWVRVSAVPIAPELATAAGRILAQVYGGDPNSADWRHFGRLAGFTNRKPEHVRDGRSPFVHIHEARGGMAERGPLVLDEAGRRLLLERVQPARAEPLPLIPAPDGVMAPGDLYRYYASKLLPLYPVPDWSRIDWMVGRDIASSNPAVDVQYVAQALREGSPSLGEARHRGNVDKYIMRTAEKVMRDPAVIAARQRLSPGESQRRL